MYAYKCQESFKTIVAPLERRTEIFQAHRQCYSKYKIYNVDTFKVGKAKKWIMF
jgi:hypothetical protein